jgi:hypothetical protein
MNFFDVNSEAGDPSFTSPAAATCRRALWLRGRVRYSVFPCATSTLSRERLSSGGCRLVWSADSVRLPRHRPKRGPIDFGVIFTFLDDIPISCPNTINSEPAISKKAPSVRQIQATTPVGRPGRFRRSGNGRPG